MSEELVYRAVGNDYVNAARIELFEIEAAAVRDERIETRLFATLLSVRLSFHAVLVELRSFRIVEAVHARRASSYEALRGA